MSRQRQEGKGVELPNNTQKSPNKDVADPNTQLQKGSSNTNTETSIFVDNAKDKIDIDSEK